ncbi:MAG: hypothetical protein ACRBBS_16680, partial [Thalassovita sp.]
PLHNARSSSPGTISLIFRRQVMNFNLFLHMRKTNAKARCGYDLHGLWLNLCDGSGADAAKTGAMSAGRPSGVLQHWSCGPAL